MSIQGDEEEVSEIHTIPRETHPAIGNSPGARGGLVQLAACSRYDTGGPTTQCDSAVLAGLQRG